MKVSKTKYFFVLFFLIFSNGFVFCQSEYKDWISIEKRDSLKIEGYLIGYYSEKCSNRDFNRTSFKEKLKNNCHTSLVESFFSTTESTFQIEEKQKDKDGEITVLQEIKSNLKQEIKGAVINSTYDYTYYQKKGHAIIYVKKDLVLSYYDAEIDGIYSQLKGKIQPTLSLINNNNISSAADDIDEMLEDLNKLIGYNALLKTYDKEKGISADNLAIVINDVYSLDTKLKGKDSRSEKLLSYQLKGDNIMATNPSLDEVKKAIGYYKDALIYVVVNTQKANEIQEKIKQAKSKVYEMSISKGNELFERKDYFEAKKYYEQACNFRSDYEDDTCNKKYALCDDKLQSREKEAKREKMRILYQDAQDYKENPKESYSKIKTVLRLAEELELDEKKPKKIEEYKKLKQDISKYLEDYNKKNKKTLKKNTRDSTRNVSARRLLFRLGGGIHTDYSNFVNLDPDDFSISNPLNNLPSSSENWMCQGVIGLRNKTSAKPVFNKNDKEISVSNVLGIMINYGNNTPDIISYLRDNKIFDIDYSFSQIGNRNTFYEVQGVLLLSEWIQFSLGKGYQTVSYIESDDVSYDYYVLGTGVSLPLFDISRKSTIRLKVDLSLLSDQGFQRYTSRGSVMFQISKKILPIVDKKTKKGLK